MVETGIDAPVQNSLNWNAVGQDGWNPKLQHGKVMYILKLHVFISRECRYISYFHLMFPLFIMCGTVEILNQAYILF